ncbi:unnamed protein product [Rotaria socialis]
MLAVAPDGGDRKQQQQHQQQQQQKPQWQQEQKHNNQINNRYSFKPKSNHASRNVLISNYPHFLRHKKEFFRKIIIPTELEKEKENIFLLSNLHYETEYFKSESEKWKIYLTAAARNKMQSNKDTNHIETIIIDNDNSLPIARPSPNGLAGLPAPLDLSEFSEMFDEWLPEPIPGQKRKIGHRRDDPPTPPSPRLPPPIIPRRALPPRNSNVPIKGGSLRSSPILNDDEKMLISQQQRSCNALLPKEQEKQDEKEKKEQLKIQSSITIVAKECSMVISPLQSSTPEKNEKIMKSPSVIPKNGIIRTATIIMSESFDFAIIPIECKYHFKRTKQKCTYETIKIHQEFLENKYKQLENEREEKLQTSFDQYIRAKVVSLIRTAIEKPIENKKNNDKRRLDNLLLDQMREKAAREMKRIGTSREQQCIQSLHEKFMRTLDLKLQYDKLEKRFLENMPPPSLNVFDKIELHAKGLKKENTYFSSLREQWKNVLRKTKLDLTTLMRQAKLTELEQEKNEYIELLEKYSLSISLRESYETLKHGVHNERKLVYALSHHHPGYPKSKLHPHFSRINFPPQANNKAFLLQNAEARVPNLGPKFVPPAPQQVLERLPKEIDVMKERIAAAWRRATRTLGREPPIVTKFCERIEGEIRKTVETENDYYLDE